jgi:hypothetical protein
MGESVDGEYEGGCAKTLQRQPRYSGFETKSSFGVMLIKGREYGNQPMN